MDYFSCLHTCLTEDLGGKKSHIDNNGLLGNEIFAPLEVGLTQLRNNYSFELFIYIMKGNIHEAE